MARPETKSARRWRLQKRAKLQAGKTLPKVSRKIKQSVVTPSACAQIAKKVLYKNTEQKYVDYNYGKTELYHNAYATGTFLQNVLASANLPSQGDTDNTRDGNQIYVSGISVPMMLYTKGDRLNTKFRIICFRYRQGYNPFATYESLFENISGNVMLDKINPDLVKVIFDKIVGNSNQLTFTGGTGNDEQTRFKKFWIPIKRKFVFQADDSRDRSAPPFNIGLVVLTYDTYGSVQNVDNISAVQVWQRLYFKDI